MAKRKVKIEDEDVTDFTVANVLSARAEFDHECIVRSIGPAIVLVLERDAPMRMEAVASTEQEVNVLLDEIANNERLPRPPHSGFSVLAGALRVRRPPRPAQRSNQ
jgi:hypothetical protein